MEETAGEASDDELYLSADDEDQNEATTSSLKKESQAHNDTNTAIQSPMRHDDATRSTFWSSMMTVQFPLSALPSYGASGDQKSVRNIAAELNKSSIRAKYVTFNWPYKGIQG